VCDVCSRSKQVPASEKRFNEARNKIKYKLQEDSVSPDAIPNLLNDFTVEYTTKVMRWMLDNNELEMTEGEKIRLVEK